MYIKLFNDDGAVSNLVTGQLIDPGKDAQKQPQEIAVMLLQKEQRGTIS